MNEKQIENFERRVREFLEIDEESQYWDDPCYRLDHTDHNLSEIAECFYKMGLEDGQFR